MCGLFGSSGEENNHSAIKLGLWVNQERGRQATGVYGESLFKATVTAELFIQDPDVAKALGEAKNIIGHTRKPTGVRLGAANAHPFVEKLADGSTLAGTHNGFLMSEFIPDLMKHIGLEKEPDVDSELIFKALNATNMDFSILGEIEGALAVAFIHKREDGSSLYLYRHQDRPLFIGETKSGILYYSSLARALQAVGADNFHEVPDHYLYRIEEGIIVDQRAIKLPKVHCLPLDCGKSNLDSNLDGPTRKIVRSKRQERQSSLPIDSYDNRYDLGDGYNYGHAGNGSAFRGPKQQSKNVGRRLPIINDEEAQLQSAWFETLRKSVIEGGVRLKGSSTMDNLLYSGIPNTCHVHATLVEETNGEPLPGWLVSLSVIGGKLQNKVVAEGITLESGAAILVVKGLSEIEKGVAIEFLAIDPYNSAEYFSVPVSLKDSKVLEVTFSVPFRRSGETDDESGEDEITTSNSDQLQAEANPHVAHISEPTSDSCTPRWVTEEGDAEEPKTPSVYKSRSGTQIKRSALSSEIMGRQGYRPEPYWTELGFTTAEEYDGGFWSFVKHEIGAAGRLDQTWGFGKRPAIAGRFFTHGRQLKWMIMGEDEQAYRILFEKEIKKKDLSEVLKIATPDSYSKPNNSYNLLRLETVRGYLRYIKDAIDKIDSAMDINDDHIQPIMTEAHGAIDDALDLSRSTLRTLEGDLLAEVAELEVEGLEAPYTT
jgi:hypothetical protein